MADMFCLFSHIRKSLTWKTDIIIYYFVIFVFISGLSSATTEIPSCKNGNCIEGNCVNETCVCRKGWKGSRCNECGGRVRFTSSTGVITDGWGNYSEDNKCAWLIIPHNAKPNTTIRIRIKQFATECGWDHLYIYDGDSVFAPLIVSYSGILQQDILANGGYIDIITRSGTVYLYFFSDAAYNMTGFNITYSTGTCLRDCSGHGTCDAGMCRCNPGYSGDGCQTEICPNSCTINGECNSDGTCHCYSGFGGPDCSELVSHGLWEVVEENAPLPGHASHRAVIVGDDMWLTGGYSFHESFNFLVKYNVVNRTWTNINPKLNMQPDFLYGHSLVHYMGTLYTFGGVMHQNISKFLWFYIIEENKWVMDRTNGSIAVAGHTAHVVDRVMYVFFGHNPLYGYMNTVQEFHIVNSTWIVSPTTGAVVQGGYGHSSVYDPTSRLIYIYGGYHSASASSYVLSDELYSFAPSMRHWTILRRSGSSRYLHSAVFLNNLMLVYGGNTHNDTSISQGAKCYSSDFLAYDFKCNAWYTLESPPKEMHNWRYGHSAVVHQDSQGHSKMYVFGGFNGQMLNDLIAYSPGNCSAYSNETYCLAARPGMVCAWVNHSVCLERSQAEEFEETGTQVSYDICNPEKDSHIYCSELKNCHSCQSSGFGCSWCDNQCSSACSNSLPCEHERRVCPSLHGCELCKDGEECQWMMTDHVGYCDGNTTLVDPSRCNSPCYIHKSCEDCTIAECMWCINQRQCVDINSYVASFVYGQCMEWTKKNEKCKETRCSDIRSCEQCHANPSCGWCNDESYTGLGRCMEGGQSGPIQESVVDYSFCPYNRWHFTDCPLCQCNGHSTCKPNSDICEQCEDLTEGLYCQKCQDGFFGNASNGGNCSACDCNGQADTCNRETGKCFCRTRGVLGDQCDSCDEMKKYFGNPKDGGTCYYELLTDFQFTFNLSKKEDRHYKEINFRNVPPSSDRDVDFKLNCSGMTYINITTKSNNHPEEKPYAMNQKCTFYRTKFQHRNHAFGVDANTTILVYVFGFQTPFWLQISFSQSPSIDLVQFFVTFFSCFLSLLIIAAALYKLKHVYDSYRIRLRRNVEREEMASRPFATALLVIEKKIDSAVIQRKDNTDIRKRKKISTRPGQIALEPLSSQKAAVLSMFVQLPTGREDWTPSGQSGLAIASALVTLGHARKQSVEYPKGEKPKIRKPAFTVHGDTCV